MKLCGELLKMTDNEMKLLKIYIKFILNYALHSVENK